MAPSLLKYLYIGIYTYIGDKSTKSVPAAMIVRRYIPLFVGPENPR
jgi:hypothetical protein